MPIPKWIAVFNKYITNRITLPIAGWIPTLAIVNHKGRISGRKYRTPIMAFEFEDGFLIALTYGLDVDWVKNLVASDSGTLEYRGENIGILNIRHTSCDDVREVFPFWFRIPLNIISVEHCLIVESK
jgi:deazaflavin-dependent oxidoreductase (nitroreductase family)